MRQYRGELMYRNGHIGAALLGYSPLGAVVLAVGFETAAVGGAAAAVLLAMVPDYDQRVPGIKHRGVTHTVTFAGGVALVTGLVGAGSGVLHPDLGGLATVGLGIFGAAVVGLGIFGAAVGGITILSHIGADALTPMGVKPFSDGRHISYNLCRADSILGNYGLLGLGIIATVLAYILGTELNTLLLG